MAKEKTAHAAQWPGHSPRSTSQPRGPLYAQQRTADPLPLPLRGPPPSVGGRVPTAGARRARSTGGSRRPVRPGGRASSRAARARVCAALAQQAPAARRAPPVGPWGNFCEMWSSSTGVKRRRLGIHRDVKLGYTRAGRPTKLWYKFRSSCCDEQEV